MLIVQDIRVREGSTEVRRRLRSEGGKEIILFATVSIGFCQLNGARKERLCHHGYDRKTPAHRWLFSRTDAIAINHS